MAEDDLVTQEARIGYDIELIPDFKVLFVFRFDKSESLRDLAVSAGPSQISAALSTERRSNFRQTSRGMSEARARDASRRKR